MRTLHCDKCSNWLKLEYNPFDKKIEEVRIIIPDMPILICLNCNIEYETDWAKYFFIPWLIKESKDKGDTVCGEVKTMSQRRYDICKDLNFKYDANDCDIIPGLQGRFAKDGYFTPVFFNQKVLHKYHSFDEYHVEATGNTYGSIYFANENMLSYGINRNGKVFCWLGDIENVPEKERIYLLSENIESDHDIGSEFYAAQIEAEFANYSDEHKLLNARSVFSQRWHEKYSSNVFQDEKNVGQMLRDIIRPVNWNKKGVIHVFNLINKICIESMRKDSIINAIKIADPNFHYDSIGTIKLIEKLIEGMNHENNAKEIMKPFFVLYDFRLILDHNFTKESEQEKLTNCYERLDIAIDYGNFEKFYYTLLGRLTESYSKLSCVLYT